MRRGTVLRVSVAVVAVLALIMVLAPAASAAPKYDIKDIGPELRAQTPSMMRIDSSELAAPPDGEPGGGAGASIAAETVLDSKIWLILNDYLGRYQATYFNLRAESANCQVWVQANLAWPAGDPRETPVITDDQVAYIMSQFDGNIYPKDTSFFGMPDFLDGASAYLPSLLGLPADYYYDAAGRSVILISNIRDDQYYDPTYPLYIAGFYSPSFEVYFDRNIITIDAYDWASRTGPSAARPFLYEGVVAHEYQHLIHDDMDADEETFVNEGCADFAEFVCGYAIATQGHVDAVAAMPENSLVVWGDQGPLEILSDYGHAYLWTLYLYEKYGGPFVQSMVWNQENGISGIDSTLAAFGSTKDFAALYHDWAAALAIDSKTPGGGLYELKNLAFTLNLGTPAAPNPQAYDMPGAPPWGTDYIWVDGDPKALAKFTFNGVDYNTFPTRWSSDGSVLWGGTGDLIDNWAIFPATGGGTLSFDTSYDIEAYWDFGFVQVSTDGGATWASLANAYTTSDHDPNAHPTVIANLPGLTGTSGGWVTMSFDLSAYAGQDILLAFRYVTDWATTEAGWFIDNVYVDGTLVSDGTDASVFKDITEIVPIPNDFTVSFIGMKANGKGNEYKVLTMKLDSMSEAGLLELNKLLKSSTKVAFLVTSDAPEGFTNYADYTYDFSFTNKGPKK